MFNSVIILYVSFLFVTVHAKSAPFIDPCKWNDKECLKKSSQKAIPIVADGVPDLGTVPLDPLVLDNVSIDEGGLKIDFSDMKIYGLKKCQMMDIERNIEEHLLRFVLECPIDIRGHYVSSGKIIFVPTQDEGPFNIKSNKFAISVKMNLNTVDNHWRFDNIEHTSEYKEKAMLNFENIFNGDAEKARLVLEVMDNQWKEIVESLGKPIVDKTINKVIQELQKLVQQIAANELEL